MDLLAIADEVCADHPEAAERLRGLSRQMVKLPTWADLRKYHMRVCDVTLGRQPAVQRDYTRHMLKTPREERVARVRQRLHGNDHALLPNNYPYWIAPLDDGRVVHHWVFWTEAKHTAAEAVALSQRALNVADVIVLESSAANKSMPEIDHFHVFWHD